MKAPPPGGAIDSARPGNPAANPAPAETAYGYPRNFLQNRFVYVVVSPRAAGLSIGINFNPDRHCNFDCAYCEVDRGSGARRDTLDLGVMSRELIQTLEAAHAGTLRDLTPYRNLPAELLKLRHVTLSGDGEPTLSPVFKEAVETVVHVRARTRQDFFKLVLLTNATGLDQPQVRQGLKLLTQRDEIWAKLDAGTDAWMQTINRPQVPMARILANILDLARERPVVIQSLFARFKGTPPPDAEIEQYAQRLLELRQQGAQIPRVQIYSPTRPSPHSDYDHLPLRSLSRIAQTVRRVAGLKAEVF